MDKLEEKVYLRQKHVKQNYKVLDEVGSGTYGRVYKALCLKTKEYLALKKLESNDDKIVQDGFPITALREIKILKQLNHPNIIKLREIIVTKPQKKNRFRGNTFLVFEYMEHDFEGLFKNKQLIKYSEGELKCMMIQILQGVKYLHEINIVHRDLKIANLLLNNKGEVKIADFGLARTMIPSNPNLSYTNKVVTLWYRAPELLLGLKKYTSQIDMWSVGCIFVELLINENLFRGDVEYKQIEKIYEICGSPDEKQWPEVTKLSNWKDLQPKKYYVRQLKEIILKKNPRLDNNAIDLIENLLTLDPKLRFNAEKALNHVYFKSEPLPVQAMEIRQIEGECHEVLMSKTKRKRQVQLNQREAQDNSQSPLGRQQSLSQNQQHMNKYMNPYQQIPKGFPGQGQLMQQQNSIKKKIPQQGSQVNNNSKDRLIQFNSQNNQNGSPQNNNQSNKNKQYKLNDSNNNIGDIDDLDDKNQSSPSKSNISQQQQLLSSLNEPYQVKAQQQSFLTIPNYQPLTNSQNLKREGLGDLENEPRIQKKVKPNNE